MIKIPFNLNDDKVNAVRKRVEVLLTILIASFILLVCYYLGVWHTTNNFADDCTHALKTTIGQIYYTCSRIDDHHE